jgi:hypothetical protein
MKSNHIRLSRLQTPKPGGGEKASFSPPIPTSTHASYIPPRALTNFISRHKKTCCNFTVTLTLYFRIVPRLGRIFNHKIKEKKKKSCYDDTEKESWACVSPLSQFERQQHPDNYAGQHRDGNRSMTQQRGGIQSTDGYGCECTAWSAELTADPKGHARKRSSARATSVAVFFVCLFPRPTAESSGVTSMHGGDRYVLVDRLVYLRGERPAAVGRGGGTTGAVLPAFLGRARDACQHFPSEPPPRLAAAWLVQSICFFTCHECNSNKVAVS